MHRLHKPITITLVSLLAFGAMAAPVTDRSLQDETLDEYLKQRGLLTMRVYALEKRLPAATGAERSRVLSDLAAS